MLLEDLIPSPDITWASQTGLYAVKTILPSCSLWVLSTVILPGASEELWSYKPFQVP